LFGFWNYPISLCPPQIKRSMVFCDAKPDFSTVLKLLTISLEKIFPGSIAQ